MSSDYDNSIRTKQLKTFRAPVFSWKLSENQSECLKSHTTHYDTRSLSTKLSLRYVFQVSLQITILSFPSNFWTWILECEKSFSVTRLHVYPCHCDPDNIMTSQKASFLSLNCPLYQSPEKSLHWLFPTVLNVSHFPLTQCSMLLFLVLFRILS